MKTTTIALFSALALSGAYASAAVDRIGLLQLDAYLADARNEAVVVREASERIAHAATLNADPSWMALDGAITRLSCQIAAAKKQKPNAPVRFDRVVLASADVERDWRALRGSLGAQDATTIREGCAHLLQALARLDPPLDAVFQDAGFRRLQFLGAGESASR
jgi:hypothetical protein